MERKKIQNKDVRNIPKIERATFISECFNVNPQALVRAWLSLPEILTEVFGDEGIQYESNQENNDKRYLAINQFYRGAWGKSMQTLMNDEKKMVKMTREQVNTLFPRCHEDGQIEVECDMTTHKDTAFGTIMGGEIIGALQGLPRGKTSGFSGLTYELIKEIGKVVEGRKILKDAVTEIYINPDKVPEQIYTAKLVGIEKPGGGARPLCMQETIAKILHKIIANRVTTYVASHMMELQKCLALTEGQMEAKTRVTENLKSGSCLVQFDFTNAFGTVRRTEIIARLKHYSVPVTYIRYISKMLKRQKIEWENEEGGVESMMIETGVPQGEPLSMLLFALGVDRIIQSFNEREGVTMTAYADDIVMILDDPLKMIDMIEEFEKESKVCGLVCNAKKTKIGVTTEIPQDIKDKLKERGIEIKNLNEEALEYVGLPVTLSKEVEEEMIRKRVDECVEMTRKLWSENIPMQMKFHLQKVCVDSTIIHILKAAPMRKEQWIRQAQVEMEKIWTESIPELKEIYARIPARYYGLGMLNLKDRRFIVRAQWEQRMKKTKENINEKMEDIEKKYYEKKIKKWTEKGLMQKFDINKVPKESNYSISRPPNTGTHRLSDKAFRLMLTLRYCSKELDSIFESLKAHSMMKCPQHKDTDMNIQHAITCNKIMRREKIRRHNMVAWKISAILMRSKKAFKVTRETYSTQQNEQNKNQRKRADILFHTKSGAEHSVDVKITSSWANKSGNNVTRARGSKADEYKGEKNLHIMLFDTAGNATKETLDFLREYHGGADEIREIQKIILEYTAHGVHFLAEEGKQREYREIRGKQRWENKMRRRDERRNNNNGNRNSEMNNNGNNQD